MNRRATLMLAIGGVAGVAFPSAGAEFQKRKATGERQLPSRTMSVAQETRGPD